MSAAVLVFALCVGSCIVGHVAILRSVVRSRSAGATPHAGVPRPRPIVEVLWALVPIVALAFLLTATWARVRENGRQKPPVVMKVAQ